MRLKSCLWCTSQAVMAEQDVCAVQLLHSSCSSFSVLCAAGEIRLAKYQEAISLLMRFGAACDRLGLRPCKAYLGAVVVCLFAQDAQQAMATLQVCLPPSAPGVCLSRRSRRQQ